MKLIKSFLVFLLISASLVNTSFHSASKSLAKPQLMAKMKYIQSMLEENRRRNESNQVLDFAFKQFKIDSIFRNLSASNRFNGCVLIAQHGQIIYKNSFGIANPMLNEPLSVNSIFQLASVSKTITGVAVLQLIEEEKVGLDDFVSLYFPSFPYNTVTIRNLLSHTSGIPDYTKLDPGHYTGYNQYASNEDALNAIVNAAQPLAFTPGSKFRYNNSNYALLALLVEKVSGEKFPDYVKAHIFAPLQMQNSYIAYPEQIWEKTNRTFGFYPNRQMYINDRFDGVFGDKGAYSTVEDMFKFDRALYPNILLKEETLKMAFSNNVFETRSSKKYGLGFRLREDQNNQKIIFHNGWWHGYRTAFHRRESDNSCVIILSNRLDRVVYSQAKQLFNILDNYYPSMMDENEELE